MLKCSWIVEAEFGGECCSLQVATIFPFPSGIGVFGSNAYISAVEPFPPMEILVSNTVVLDVPSGLAHISSIESGSRSNETNVSTAISRHALPSGIIEMLLRFVDAAIDLRGIRNVGLPVAPSSATNAVPKPAVTPSVR